MDEKVLTSFYPQIRKTTYNPNMFSLYQANLIEKNNSKDDYLDIFQQIKSKKKLLDNGSLYHNFFIKSNKQKQYFLKHQFINQNNQAPIPLITEANYNKKYFSYKKLSNNATLSESINFKKKKLKVRNRLSSPKKLINRIIKFEKKKTKMKAIKISKKYIPMELSNSYKNFIEKINRTKFLDHANSNNDYAHNIRTNFFISKMNESLKQEKERNEKYIRREREKMEGYKELRDKVLYPSMEIQKLSNEIKAIIRKNNDFDINEKREPFFYSFTNRINYLFDNYKPPNIKNNLTKIKYEDMHNDKELYLIYRVGNSCINYLANAKVRIQRERDERIKFFMEKNKITQKYGFYKKLFTKNIYNSKEEIEKLIYKDYYTKNIDEFPKKEKEAPNLEEEFENKNYFENKYERFENVCIAETRLKKFFLDNINFKKNKLKKL